MAGRLSRWAGTLAVAAVASTAVLVGDQALAVPAGTITTESFASPTMGEEVDYNLYLPAGYATDPQTRYPVLYLLHGRGDSMAAWTQAKGDLDQMIADKQIPPVIAVMPDAPWSSRAGYYVDSAYRGADPGRPIETTFVVDLVAHVDTAYRTVADRSGRVVAGYSMGGNGALRYSLAHPEVFGGSIVLSPAAYNPLPPTGSSAREFGAFGMGKRLFVDSVYREQSYPALLTPFAATGLSTNMYVAAGDDEYKEPLRKDIEHDIDYEAATLYNRISRVPGVSAELRIVDGGHDWGTWGPQFAAGARYVLAHVAVPEAAPMDAVLTGSPGADRAGGVATDAAGNTYQALAASGPVLGQAYAGDTDVVLAKYAPGGGLVWARSLGSAATERAYGVALTADGGPVVVGYTKGDLDGAHAANTTDDIFVAAYDAGGTQRWLRQIGTSGLADRGYGVTVDGTGAVVVAGYTKGDLGGPNAGDKDLFVAKLDPAGTQQWLRQLGTTGEDKVYGVAAAGKDIYLAGSTTGDLAGSVGGTDAFVTHVGADGTVGWTKQIGTTATDELWSVAAGADGHVYAAGYSAGDFAAPLVGDKDVVVVSLDPAGTVVDQDQLGTPGNDKGAAVATAADGSVYVAAFTEGALGGSSVGGVDCVVVRYTAGLEQQWVRQLGTTGTDGADEFAEANLYASATAGGVTVTGLTDGDTSTTAAIGGGDVFLARLDSAGAVLTAA